MASRFQRPLGSHGPRAVTFIFLGVSLLVLSSCNQQIRTSDRDLVYIDVAEYHELINRESGRTQSGSSDVITIDARSEKHYNASHIRGALCLPLSEDLDRYPQLKRARHLVVYGDHSSDARAKALAKKLVARGFDRVVVLEGGLQEWTKLGYPLAGIEESSN